MKTILERHVRLLVFRSCGVIKAWENNGQMFFQTMFFNTTDDKVESSELDLVQAPFTLADLQNQRDEETQTILVELSQGNAIDGTQGRSEKKGFTELIPTLTEAKCIHAFLAKSPREDSGMFKVEFNSAFSLRAEKYKSTPLNN